MHAVYDLYVFYMCALYVLHVNYVCAVCVCSGLIVSSSSILHSRSLLRGYCSGRRHLHPLDPGHGFGSNDASSSSSEASPRDFSLGQQRNPAHVADLEAQLRWPSRAEVSQTEYTNLHDMT
ncbi:unnamed protein product [Protopolystoma xenopodis]|uniref:Uncharacterized protein n=1 Tax=Protopolystoma xenopodis TaxID=117903 RepID=A0A448XDL3_9PLAT|nr:unnamed protein product [Protopolystoma xenopodis]